MNHLSHLIIDRLQDIFPIVLATRSRRTDDAEVSLLTRVIAAIAPMLVTSALSLGAAWLVVHDDINEIRANQRQLINTIQERQEAQTQWYLKKDVKDDEQDKRINQAEIGIAKFSK